MIISQLKTSHSLPFDYTVIDGKPFVPKILTISPIKKTINSFRKIIEIYPYGTDIDQLILDIIHPNKKVAQSYLNELLKTFDLDGIKDRQLEYKNTIEFVEKRSSILNKELNFIEQRKQEFMQINGISNIENDASYNIQEQYTYDAQLFSAESQKSLAKFLLSSLKENEFDYLPINIGLEKFDLNVIISQYNDAINRRNKFLLDGGANNILVRNIEKQLIDYLKNINNSLNNYIKSLDIQINSIKTKEKQYLDKYIDIPEKQKTLRSIERELSTRGIVFITYKKRKKLHQFCCG